MTITGQSSLPKDQIDQMIKDAEAHAEEDRKRRDEAEARNQADTLVYQTEKVLREQGEKVAADEKAKVEEALKSVKEVLADQQAPADRIRSATEGLITASQSFSQRLYEQAGAAAGGPAGGPTGGPAPSDDEVVDAEIVDEQ